MRLRIVAFGVLCLLCAGCANQVAPTGGKTDTSPPKLLEADPPQSTLNFKNLTITLRFNKFLQNIDPSKIYITPELNKKLKIVQVHKNIVVRLSPPFRDSTTYTIHFNDAIADINEGNKLKDFDFVFSTGPVIDSLKIEGRLIDAYTNNPVKDALVMLYDKTYDSVPFKEKPVYYTRSGSKGEYSLTHIKAGRYKLFALVDKDGNLKYSQAGEQIGYLDSTLFIRTNLSNVNLRLFTNKPDKQKIIRASCTLPGEIFIKWTMPQKPSITITCKESPLVFDSLRNSDSLALYVINTYTDSVKLYIKNGDYKDTALVMMKLPSTSGRNKMSLKLSNSLLCDKGGCVVDDTLIITANHPLKSFDSTRLFFTSDTGKNKRRVIFPLFSNLHGGRLKFFIPPAQQDKIITCSIKKNAFTDVFGLSNADSIILKFSKMTDEQKGNLAFHISPPNGVKNLILFLVKDNIRVFPVSMPGVKNGGLSFSFKSLLPGNYSAFVVEDTNNNGYWDTGDYLYHRQPEKVFTYPNVITIRGNWDNELNWEIKL